MSRERGSVQRSNPDAQPPATPFDPAGLNRGRQAAADAIPAAVKRLVAHAETGYYSRGEDPRGDLLALHAVATGGRGGDKGGGIALNFRDLLVQVQGEAWRQQLDTVDVKVIPATSRPPPPEVEEEVER